MNEETTITNYNTYKLPSDISISYIGDVFVNSNVDPKSYTHGIPVDVLVSTSSGQSFIQNTAMHLMAASPLIEMDAYGNISQVGEAQAKMIADKCVQYATYLNDAIVSTDSDNFKDKPTLVKELKETKEKLKEKTKELILSKQYVRDLKNALLKQNIPNEPTEPTDDDLKKEWKEEEIDS